MGDDNSRLRRESAAGGAGNGELGKSERAAFMGILWLDAARSPTPRAIRLGQKMSR